MRYIKYVAVLVLGFLLAKFWFDKKEAQSHRKEEIQVILSGVKNMSKLVVTEGSFSEIYNYEDSKPYFNNLISFDKKAIITVNAKVEVGYDLGQLEIQVDSIGKQILINKIPEESLTISPEIKYFDLQQSQFNSFSKEELNAINEKSIAKIKETIEVSNLKEQAKERLFIELSKIYQLSAIYNWEVVDNTNQNILTHLKL